MAGWDASKAAAINNLMWDIQGAGVALCPNDRNGPKAERFLAAAPGGVSSNRPHIVSGHWVREFSKRAQSYQRAQEGGSPRNYADWLATQWRTQEEFSRQQGWIREYHVLSNNDRRSGEPDLYLVEVFDHVPTAAEQVQRQQAFERMMRRDPHQLSTESGQRATMRRITGSMMLQELNLRAH